MCSPIRVVGAIFVDGDRVLACRKAPGKSLAGLWEFPGGKIEPGESPEEALARELSEELSLTAVVGDKVTTTVHTYDFATIELTTFLCTIQSGELVLTDHDATRWVTAAEAQTLDWAPADIPAVELISSRL
ncbi:MULTISPECIES: (deoxy)nucleoside triphosphate pyrophosphohydrolase [Corynebacterium]|uniref:8-oxo-dGTP diphosphatase n=1 Tax=Corynebacterium singulare TaxID=161899 RepID=A0ABS9PVE6_9CORY|nr:MULTISPECIES: (deoxy)nucleoside triphosphate pyrophosphohydrolase [Corynebacterium]MCG7276555.1 (deoxy)nucleoside triphosphate pyrophosphohydrolase [Corynebacterium singulare]OFT61414.1 hydrolase [Corynebacterium sp. HMSC05E07]